MKRVLVTGASGFIGRRALAPLVARGYEVHAVDLRGASTVVEGVAWHRADLLAPGGAAAVVSAVRPTHLLHLAWYATHRLFWASPENLRWVAASLDLARAFHEGGGRRAVFAGSCAEYDWAHGWCSEGVTPLVPATLYGAAKDALRRTIEAYARATGLSWAWGRVFFLYGPDEHPDRIVPAVARAVLRGEHTRCSHGRQVRDFLHVDDVAAAFAATLDAAAVEGAVNVASGEARPLRAIVEAVAGAAGRLDLVRLGDVPSPPDEPPFLVADVRRLRDAVGFVPRWSLEEGAADAVRFWRDAERT